MLCVSYCHVLNVRSIKFVSRISNIRSSYPTENVLYSQCKDKPRAFSLGKYLMLFVGMLQNNACLHSLGKIRWGCVVLKNFHCSHLYVLKVKE
jgi:hypothetical protein